MEQDAGWKRDEQRQQHRRWQLRRKIQKTVVAVRQVEAVVAVRQVGAMVAVRQVGATVDQVAMQKYLAEWQLGRR